MTTITDYLKSSFPPQKELEQLPSSTQSIASVFKLTESATKPTLKPARVIALTKMNELHSIKPISLRTLIETDFSVCNY